MPLLVSKLRSVTVGELRNVQENERAAHFYGELRSLAASPYD